MLGFVAAMESEAEAVLSAFSEKTEALEWGRRVVRGKFRGEPVLLVVSGVGKANAAAATQLAIADGATGIVNAGVSRGLDADSGTWNAVPSRRCARGRGFRVLR